MTKRKTDTEIVLIVTRSTSPWLLSIYWTTSLLLLVVVPLNSDNSVWSQ